MQILATTAIRKKQVSEILNFSQSCVAIVHQWCFVLQFSCFNWFNNLNLFINSLYSSFLLQSLVGHDYRNLPFETFCPCNPHNPDSLVNRTVVDAVGQVSPNSVNFPAQRFFCRKCCSWRCPCRWCLKVLRFLFSLLMSNLLFWCRAPPCYLFCVGYHLHWLAIFWMSLRFAQNSG